MVEESRSAKLDEAARPRRTLSRSVRQAFTAIALIALPILLVTLGLVLVGPIPFVIIDRKSDRVELDLNNLVAGLNSYQRKHNAFPPEDGWVTALEFDHPPLDPWGREYEYRNQNGRAVILTRGADGIDGGTGGDTDIAQTISMATAH